MVVAHRHMVKAMNKRATLVADPKKNWKEEKSFRSLVQWTETASTEDLRQLADDLEKLSDDELAKTPVGRLICNVSFNR